ncbi:hypothetical protein GE09DRAFT_439492 [Coniochaeta sp. 2T2.1]|nr:hypothetical protein GE09DRAFT_439492 [Coniochaeta sp. 2T2.1]
MQFLTIATTALLAALASAAPAPAAKRVAQRTVPEVTLTYTGAADTFFAIAVPADGQPYTIQDKLSVTYVSSNAPAGVTCTSTGIDGSVTVNYGPQEFVPIGPPQTQVEVTCSSY